MLRDQIRSFDREHLERPGHLPGVEIAALPHHVFEKRDLALVDEEHQLAGLGEVDLGGKQARLASRSSPSRAMAAAVIASSVPPRQ